MGNTPPPAPNGPVANLRLWPAPVNGDLAALPASAIGVPPW
jgi:hypothetical protein